jgi:Methyltransferase domain
MHTIRPFKLFTLVEGSPLERLVQVPIPSRIGFGGLNMLETFSLIAASRIVRARQLFEFGTFLGRTTLNLALNTPDDSEIVTLDLDEHHVDGLEQNVPDALATKIHLASVTSLDFIGTHVSHKVKMLSGNSITFDFSSYKRMMNLVFIDGGHDLDTVQSDTENAFEMVRMDTPSCILWHDYGSPDYKPLTAYLDGLSKDRPIFHIGDSMLCVWFNDHGNSIVSRLLQE